MKYTETIRDKSSAIGTASHTPLIPNSIGKAKIHITTNTKVLKNERIAEIFPLESEVKSAELNKLIPINKKDKEKIFNPESAISYTLLPLLAKIVTNESAFHKPNIKTSAEIIIILIILI